MKERALAKSGSAAPLTSRKTIVVVSDWIDGYGESSCVTQTSAGSGQWRSITPACEPWTGESRGQIDVRGGYLERLPLSLVASGIVEQGEIWYYWGGKGEPPFARESSWLARRAFRLEQARPPFGSAEMAAFVKAFGAPHILVVLGLGIAPELLELCANSLIIYNSIDAPSLRVPERASRHFDLVLTGAQWQSDEVRARHPEMATAILPIGPEFAAPDQFRPLGTPKDLDLIYVAAAQPYKRHDILFDAMARLPRDVRALCLFGYGEQADELRRRAAEQPLSIEFVGPPGVPCDEVNRLMNRARFGVVCGVDDGAPAILTEYMLAGLPVLANAELSCGLQFILPETGMTATADGFAEAIMAMRSQYIAYDPRRAVLERWTWPHSVEKLRVLIEPLCNVKRIRALG